MVPIGRDISHDAARLYCKRLAQRLEAAAPARYTTSSAPAKRNKRIYIDYLRNGTRHDVDRRLFPARAGGIPGRRSGDVGAGRARDPPGCIHDRAATPGGAAAQANVKTFYGNASNAPPAAGGLIAVILAKCSSTRARCRTQLRINRNDRRSVRNSNRWHAAQLPRPKDRGDRPGVNLPLQSKKERQRQPRR